METAPAYLDFKQYFLIPADPETLYHALTRSATIQLWSGEPAVMEEVPGTEFSLWNESISGINLEFEPNRKIVQEWDFGEQEIPSVVTIILHPDKRGTSVELRHTGIPAEAYDNIVEGWRDAYFGSLTDFYSGS